MLTLQAGKQVTRQNCCPKANYPQAEKCGCDECTGCGHIFLCADCHYGRDTCLPCTVRARLMARLEVE